MTKYLKQFFLTLYVGVFFFAVASFLWVCWYEYQKAYESMNWPTVQGEILNSDVSIHLDHSGVHVTYVPVVTYKFEVNETEYESDRLRIDNLRYCNREGAENSIKEYTAGVQIPVFYDPDQHANSVLIPRSEASFETFIEIGLSSFFILVFLGLALYLFFRARKSPPVNYPDFMGRFFRKWVFPFFLRLMYGSAIILSGSAILGYYLALDSSTWPSVQGTIIESLVDTRVNDEETSYAPQVKYEYVVDEIRHEGDRIRMFYPESSTWEFSQTIVEEYPVGREVNVFYKPDDPSWAVLIQGDEENAYRYLFDGSFAIIVSTLVMTILRLDNRRTTLIPQEFTDGTHDQNREQ
ncbi:hypothetical protein Pla110_16250 [Polystyrenella longa]|uniref:DUF3592 domain-containing protein n=1 Tax=Polystyrenella longa TaxID=2528007 RepID=A0A518CKZ7_9PLAN|nr:DUF3592 domain-containing protein [Polystyrenella longa]QDU79905.1 hypothetical protein Pla110_16250 [Polystyrenella longa]